MSSQAKRYNGEKKLNMKKVFAAIIALAVVIMVIVGISKLIGGKRNKNRRKNSSKSIFCSIYR